MLQDLYLAEYGVPGGARRHSSVCSDSIWSGPAPGSIGKIGTAGSLSSPTSLHPCWDIWGPQISQPMMVPAAQPASPPPHWSTPLWNHSSSGVPLKPVTTPTSSASSLTNPPLSPPTSPIGSPVESAKLTPPTAISPDNVDPNLIADTPGTLYLVEFKGGRRDVYTSLHGPYRVGQLVIVDADRGKDVGAVVTCNVSREEAAALKFKQHVERQTVLMQCAAASKDATTSTQLGVCTPKHILRQASLTETQLHEKWLDEARAVQMCNRKVREHNLDMVIIDAEYQWDRRKLTFFYRAGHRVDFRELVRELFRMYKTRIWMCVVPQDAP